MPDPWEQARRDPALLERIMLGALKDHDMKGVHAALTLLAVVDPHRAEYLRDALLLGLDLASASRAEPVSNDWITP